MHACCSGSDLSSLTHPTTMSEQLLKTKKRIHPFFGVAAVLLFLCGASQAQQVSGKVTSDDGIGVPGVNVIIEGTTLGTSTDSDGRYSLAVTQPNSTLV